MNQAANRLQPGVPDPSFGEEGRRIWPFKGLQSVGPQAMVVLPNDKLIVVSRMHREGQGFEVARLTDRGELDSGTGFGDGQQGFVHFILPDTNFTGRYTITLLSDAGVLIAVQYGNRTGSGIAVIRFHEDGRVNTAFGESGVVFLDWLLGETTEPDVSLKRPIGKEPVFERAHSDLREGAGYSASAIEQPDGKIVLKMSGTDTSNPEWTGRGMLVRLEPDGSFDKTLNGTGRVFVEFDGVIESLGRGMAIQPDGRYLVYGETRGDDGFGWYLVRLNVDGTQDSQFTNFRWPNPENNLRLTDIAVREADGSFFVVGWDYEDDFNAKSVIFAFNPNGGFNRVFNNGQPLFSKLLPNGETWAGCSFSAGAGDRLIVSGLTGGWLVTENSVAITARYLMTGDLDQAFGGDGYVLYQRPEWWQAARDQVLIADGRIVTCGEFYAPGVFLPHAGWLIRYQV